MLKFNTFILEWKKETKKLKSTYYTKRLSISKIELEYICNKLNINYNLLKFISSGSFGNAYRIDDKVLKITNDKREAKAVYDLIKVGGNDSVVKYYSINSYKEDKYIIIMDYLQPLGKYIKNNNVYCLIDECLDIIYDNWRKIKKENLINEIKNKWTLDNYDLVYIDKIWKLYIDIKDIVKNPDLHLGNIGVNKDGAFMIFDFSDLVRVRKFNEPKIL